MGLIPESDEERAEAYLQTFNKWIIRNPEQKYLFCEHGKYCGATGPGSYLHNCITCKGATVIG